MLKRTKWLTAKPSGRRNAETHKGVKEEMVISSFKTNKQTKRERESTHTHTHKSMHASTHTHMNAFKYTHTHTHMNACKHTHTQI